MTQHEQWRGCGCDKMNGQEVCGLTVLRSGNSFVQRSENTEVRRTKSN